MCCFRNGTSLWGTESGGGGRRFILWPGLLRPVATNCPWNSGDCARHALKDLSTEDT